VLRELRPGDPRLIGPYRVVGQLGDGGMGRVFLGRSAGGRPVAVKVIRSDLAADPDFRIRFRREVAAARKVSGLFTAMVVDADVDAPEPWLATAYVAGPSLSEAISDHGPLPLDSVLALAAGLAESLVAIHAAGVVHRDLKPSNVLLGRDGPCVIDFGISRAAEATAVTRAGFVIGSPGFMSPEQAEGNDVGPASDIFSLGAVLAFAASGKPPFGDGSTAALVYRVVHAPPRLDGVPDEIRPLIERCLAKDPGQRPAASELLAEAEAVQPATGWLPEPITRAFPDSLASAVAEPPAPAAAEPADADWPVTRDSVLIVPKPETVPPVAEAAAPAAEIIPPDAETAAPAAETAPPAAETAALAAGLVAAEAETAATADKLAASEAQPEAEPEAEPEAQPGAEPEAQPGAEPEAQTVVPPGEKTAATAETAAPGLAATFGLAATPGLAAAGEPPAPEADVVPLPVGEVARRPPRRRVRLIVLGSAAAVVAIASVATGLALSGPSHAASSHLGAVAEASTPQGTITTFSQAATSSPSASAARTKPHASASSSRRPGTQPTAADVTTQPPTTAPSTSGSTPKPSVKPTPKPSAKPTPKSSPKPTQPATYSVSVSGGSEDSCGDVGAVHSSAGASVEFSFVDHSSANVQIAMINAAGAVLPEATIASGGVYTAGTNVGDYWVVETAGGGCLAVVGVDGSGEAVVS
jgi:Protein kinase domain